MLDVVWSLVPSPILSTDLNFQLNAPLYPLIPILLPPYKLASLQAQAMISQNILPLLHVGILVPLLVPQLFHDVHYGEAIHLNGVSAFRAARQARQRISFFLESLLHSDLTTSLPGDDKFAV
jgi:hypothetical protein